MLTEPGLTTAEARVLLARYGPNRLVPEKQRPTLLWLLRPFADPMALLLLVAGVAYLALGERFDAIVALAALIPVTLVSLVLEARAERAIAQLQQLTAPKASVWRDGRRQVIAAEDLVPGDLVFLQEGDIIPADGTLVEGGQLAVDESALTGESLPVTKDGSTPDEQPSVFAGTTLLSGRGVARVTTTGQQTRYGRIGELLATISQPPTPLQQIVQRLIGRLAIVALALCIGVAAIELLAGRGLVAAITAGISLAIAAIPEEFPMVFTLYLALGAWRLARERALIRKLTAVETLGATTVICADKTGTLTLGRVEVVALASLKGVTRPRGGLDPDLRSLLEAAVLASEPDPFDPLEQAILRFAASQDIDVAALHGGMLVQDYPFDARAKYMSHVWQRDGSFQVFAKGAVEGILTQSDAPPEARRRALATHRDLAAEGLRVIAVGTGMLPQVTGDRARDERSLRFLGLLAVADPLRPGVAAALAECRAAGIRVIMLTGDHPVTAHAVAEALQLPHEDTRIATGDDLDAADDVALAELARGVNIFARIRPEQKYRLVRALRTSGEIVAMTGDGVNDAPALREADIGVAMGRRGTEVARAAATMVLLDDNFATIVGAIRDGRRIFENLRRAFVYLIAFHTPLLLGALVVPLVGVPLLLLPVHLVWLELIVHPTASLVFEADPPPADLMRRPPRRHGTTLLSGADFIRASARGLALFAAMLALYLARLGQGASEDEARALALAALIMSQSIVVLSIRAVDQPLWRHRLQGNLALLVTTTAVLVTLLAALYVPPIAASLRLAPLSPGDWAIVGIVTAVASLWLEPVKAWRQRTPPPGGSSR